MNWPEQLLTTWIVLAFAVVIAARVGHRHGRLAVVGVFGATWVILVLSALGWEWALLELNPFAAILASQLPLPTIAVCVTALPVLWRSGRATVRNATIWGVAAATFVSFLFPPLALIVGCTVPRSYDPCIQPSVESSLASRTTKSSTIASYYYRCPNPSVRELMFDRDYGTVQLEWWGGSPHRLHVSGQTPVGGPLRIGVKRIDSNGNRRAIAEPSESVVVAFRQTQDLKPTGLSLSEHAERFSVTVFQPDGVPLEEIPLRYVPQACDCPHFDCL